MDPSTGKHCVDNRDGTPGHGRGGYGAEAGLLRTAPLTQHQSGKWWSGVEHLGVLLLVNAKESGTPASLELQQRASAPRAPEKVALIPNPQSLAADPPTQGPWMGKEVGRGI